MSDERRRSGRLAPPAHGTRVFANRYIEGIPHLIEVLDVSSDGMQIRRILEPERRTETYPLELCIGGVTFWAWTRRVWRRGNREALRFVGADPFDRARLRKFLRSALAA